MPGARGVMRSIELRYRLRKIAPDVFHVHSIFAVKDWSQAPWILAMCTFHPLVLTAWGSDLLQVLNISRAAQILVRFAMRSADLITADAQPLLDVARFVGVARERLHEIQFGVDTELFDPEIETHWIREQLNLGSGPVVYSPRAFMPIYNQLSIVEAVPIVLQIYPHCRFIFKRRPDYHSSEYEAQVRQRIEELGIAHAVRIVPPLLYEQLPALYALSDVIVSVPKSDGTPRSVLEAMACGAFPVVSDVTALHEWVNNGDNGIFVRSVQAQEIAEAILRALSSREILNTAKMENRKIVESRGSSEFWVTKLEALYRMVIQ